MKTISFFIAFIFSFSGFFGEPAKGNETSQAWRETGFNMDFFLMKMKTQCHKDEKSFAGCAMTLNHLFSNVDANDPRQLRVSDLNQLEMVPYPEKESPASLGERLAFENQRRESFRTFFRSQTEGKQGDGPVFIEGFDDLLITGAALVSIRVSEENQAYFLGGVYNFLLKEVVDPYASLYPSVRMKKKTSEYVGIGATIAKYRTDDETLNGFIVVNPFDNSPAPSGLKKGDLILAIDGVSVKWESVREVANRVQDFEETRVELTVRNFCDNEQRDIRVTRRRVTRSFDWKENNRFVNIQKPESPCPGKKSSDGDSKALYVPLRFFGYSREESFRLCQEFVELQKKDLENPKSVGMIIDLRGNPGGNNETVLCMLDSLIAGTDLLFKEVPVESGEITNAEPLSYYFTDTAPIVMEIDSSMKNVSYNKNIVVLVDRGSTSGAEVFAGTIQDMKRGWVIGDRTAGKGTVQTVYSFVLGNNPENNFLSLKQTTAVYVLNSGRSPQNFGIIPDFRFSGTGEPIEDQTDYVSFGEKFHFNNIKFDNDQWKQNRPDEVLTLNTCIHQDDKMGSILKGKIQREEKYNRPFVADYPLELAKDVLGCLSVVEPPP